MQDARRFQVQSTRIELQPFNEYGNMIVQVDDLVCIRWTACHVHLTFLVERRFRLFQHAIGL